jgi:TolB-like protein/Flp pilus assembly protein TadD
VKILPEAFSADPNRLARFEREAKLLASLNHANIATIYGLYAEEGRRFLAMELIPGQDLARRLDERSPPLAEALSIGRQIASALEATHERGVIHRDLKPANVYVTPAGEVKVLDFGIARGVGPAGLADPDGHEFGTERTQPGMILGTVAYMSPEQARGKTVGPATDLWSFGCVLFRMLAGSPAFGGETRWDQLAAVLREDPDWSLLPGDTPGAVRDLLRRCLCKNPDERLADAGEARRILADVLGLTTGAGSAPPSAADLVSAGPVRSEARWAVVVVLLTVIGAALSFWALVGRDEGREGAEEGRAVGTGAPRSVAVLPFQSVGGGEENEAFTAGMHDDILNRLAKIGALTVISRTSVMEYRDTAKNLREIAEELGVATVLEGAVRRAGDQVRINVRLVDAYSDKPLWAETYNRELSMEEIFAVQSDIAESIAQKLEATLTADELRYIGTPPTDNLEAYDFYARAVSYLGRPGQIEDNLLASRKMFRRAIELDPTFARAYAGLSRAARDHYWMGGGSHEALEEAVSAAERAMELQPDLPESHLALGSSFYIRRDYDRALEEFRIASQGLPSDSELMRWRAYVVRRRSKWDEALELLRRAMVVNPRDPEAPLEYGFTLLCMREYDEALTYFARARELAPDYPAARLFAALAPVLRDGTREQARAAADEIDAVAPGPWKYAHGWQVMLYAREFDRAAELVAPLDRVLGQWHDYPTELLVGWAHLLGGDEVAARRELESARAVLESDVQANPDEPKLHGALGVAYAALGRDEEALREGRKAVELLPIEKDAFVGAWQLQDLCWIYVMTGEYDAALEAFDRLLSVPSVWSIEAIRLDPRFEPLAQHPGVAGLIAKHSASKG